MNSLLEERNIQPRLILNGKRYYNPSDVDNIPLLLRVSSAPSSASDTLLRAAHGTTLPPEEHLLRPISDSTDSETVAQLLSAVTEPLQATLGITESHQAR